jgi:hypothetical protein
VTASCEGGDEHFDSPKLGEISSINQQTLAFK